MAATCCKNCTLAPRQRIEHSAISRAAFGSCLEHSSGIAVAGTGTTVLNRQRVRILLGETAREIGILMFVFVPLEATFSERSIDPAAVVGLLLISLVLILCGILAEV